MLIGEFHNKIDDKNRLAVPKKFRDELTLPYVLTKGYENSLVLVDSQSWQEITREIQSNSYILKSLRETTRFLVGGAVELSLDQQGRITIPKHLMSFASLTKNVVIVGLMRWVEIWDEAQWEKHQKMLQENASSISEELFSKGNGNTSGQQSGQNEKS